MAAWDPGVDWPCLGSVEQPFQFQFQIQRRHVERRAMCSEPCTTLAPGAGLDWQQQQLADEATGHSPPQTETSPAAMFSD